MKTSDDPRHRQRVDAVKQLFAQSFTDQDDLAERTKKVLKNTEEIDKQIREIKKNHKKHHQDYKKSYEKFSTPEYRSYVLNILSSQKVIDKLREWNIVD